MVGCEENPPRVRDQKEKLYPDRPLNGAVEVLSIAKRDNAAAIAVPVTIAVTYGDGKTTETVVIVNDATTVAQIPLTGAVRSVEANPDGAAIAVIEKK